MPVEEVCNHRWRKTGGFWEGQDKKGKHVWGPVVKCEGQCRLTIYPTDDEWEKLQENPQMELKLRACKAEQVC